MRAALALLALTLLAACQQKPATLAVEDARVRLSANREAPSVGYFTLKGGESDERLMAVFSPAVIRTEMHESMTSGTMTSMKPLAGGVAVPARSTVEFKEGGKHLMLTYVNPGITPKRTLPMVFTFASGTKLEVDAVVTGPGGAAPRP